MTRYKLPDVLGGGEVEATETYPGRYGLGPEYRLADGITMILGGWRLEPVPPPIPPEPEPGAYLIGDRLAVRFKVPAGWTAWHWQTGPDRADESDSWELAWAAIGGPIQRLVPEREALPEVELPWTGSTISGCRVAIHSADADGDVRVEWKAGEYVRSETALAMAAALVAAVRAADRTSQAASTEDGAS